jgi:hypothetical protein
MDAGQYRDLNKKTPKEAAEIIGSVEKHSYLAHAIRAIQLAILKTKGKNFPIATFVGSNNKKSAIHFFDGGCEIRLPQDCQEIDDIKIRQILAHELGHIIYNIYRLETPEIIEKEICTDEEELRAWEFAYHLVKKKSDEHRSNKVINKHIFEKADLIQSITALVRDKRPTILDELIQYLDTV